MRKVKNFTKHRHKNKDGRRIPCLNTVLDRPHPSDELVFWAEDLFSVNDNHYNLVGEEPSVTNLFLGMLYEKINFAKTRFKAKELAVTRLSEWDAYYKSPVAMPLAERMIDSLTSFSDWLTTMDLTIESEIPVECETYQFGTINVPLSQKGNTVSLLVFPPPHANYEKLMFYAYGHLKAYVDTHKTLDFKGVWILSINPNFKPQIPVPDQPVGTLQFHWIPVETLRPYKRKFTMLREKYEITKKITVALRNHRETSTFATNPKLKKRRKKKSDSKKMDDSTLQSSIESLFAEELGEPKPKKKRKKKKKKR